MAPRPNWKGFLKLSLVSCGVSMYPATSTSQRIHFNIINKETLLAAQKDPDKYRNLIVRIAGYSAYFVDLSPMQQAEIIARTEEQLG